MKKFSPFLLFTYLLFQGCKPGTPFPLPVKNKSFTGTYLNQTYLDQIRDSIAGTIPFYCSSLYFISKDSVEVDNGIESFKLAIRIHGDTCTLLSAYATAGGLKNINCFYINESVLTVMDTGFTMKISPSQFVLTNSLSVDFPSALNQATIAGKYQDTKAKNSKSEIEFSADGKVTGLSTFTNYEICYAGDCLSEPLNPANIILLSSTKASDAFTWYIDKNTSLLHISYLTKPSTDIKGERKVSGEFKSLKKL